MTQNGCIPKVIDYTEKSQELFECLLDGEIGLIVKQLVKLNFDPMIQKRKMILYQQKELRSLGYSSLDQIQSSKDRKKI